MGDTGESSITPICGPDGHRQPPPDAPRVWENTDRAQAVMEGAAGPEPPATPTCPNCGLVGDRHVTYYGVHVLLEPGIPVPAHMVPAWHRWYIDSNGTAWNSREDEPMPGAVCRIPHRIACPGLKLEEIGLWRWLDAVRAENARRARRKADEEATPEELPEVG
ncbi:DUF6083 domain-containing protein [Streptomyces phaeochromogenes]|uniref:DUF6083 domain-containing protein n=1 Tax=Streptomyces phaeochromogenes TaxID=1923 RepID=UPI002DDC7292|nr:DUF6083 domain-containing protein [Streptomyces phaeochromogenes]WRZ31946.1 DUF6083 domain-containing protein [Streptomyces phaeochromogenes]